MRRTWLLVSVALATTFPCAGSASAEPLPRKRVAIKLTDGSTVTGTLVARDGSQIVVVGDDGKTRAIASDRVAGTTDLPTVDRVVLEDGTIVEGKVTATRPGQSVTITKTDGAEQTIEWANVRDIVVRLDPSAIPPDAAPLIVGAAAGATVTTTSAIRVDRSGASFDLTRECAATPDTPKCKEHANVAINRGRVSASWESEDEHGRRHASIDTSGAHAGFERDCATNPNDQECIERGGIDLSRGGLSAGYSREQATRVKEPRSGSMNVGLNAGVGYAFSTGGQLQGTKMMFVPIDLTISALLGGKFPNESGGSWMGLKIEPMVSGLFVFTTLDTGQTTGTGSLFGYRLGGTLAFQYLHFGAMSKGSLKQKGFGVSLGGYMAVQGISGSISTTTCVAVVGCISNSQSISSTDLSYGPSLTLTFPQYNAGTAKYSAFNVNFMVLPTGDMTIAFASAGATF